MTLGFIEPYASAGASEGDRLGVGDRIFNVNANGQPMLENFDLLGEAGAGMTAVTRTFPVEVTGGRLVLAFIPVEGDAIVSNIKVVRQQ